MQDFNKTEKILFEYFTVQEANLFVFYRIPKELFTNPKYKKLSAEAKILYGLLLDRNGLSLQNGWIDNEGHIYIYFSREEAMEMLSIGTEKVVKLFKELNEVSLIKEVRQGLNRPNIIYVGKFLASHVDIPTGFRFSKVRTFGNRKSRSSEIESQEVRKSKSNNTNINKTYRNENEMSQSVVSLPAASQPDQKTSTTDRLTSASSRPIPEREQAALTTIYEQSQTAHSPAQDFVEHVIKKLYSDGNMPYILKMGLTHDEIRSRLFQLQPAHVERALTKSKQATNKELYFAKALLSAIVELALNDLPIDPSAPPPPRPQRQIARSQRDNFEQREYSDEELERFYVNVTEER